MLNAEGGEGGLPTDGLRGLFELVEAFSRGFRNIS